MQLDLKRRGDEIERKTKEVEWLNRKYEKLVSSQQGGPEAGMLFFFLFFLCVWKARKDSFCSHVALTISLSCLVAVVRCCQAKSKVWS